MIVEPLALSESPSPEGKSTLQQFVENYGGAESELLDPVKKACRGPDGQFVPLLVRMAIAVNRSGAQMTTLTDVFFKYFMQLIDPQFPTDDRDREAKKFDRLYKAARWCVETYYLDGERRALSDGKELQRSLRDAGILLPDPRECQTESVWFFHDLMQSYLTAYGLWRLLQGFDGEPPKLRCADGSVRWTMEDTLLRVVAAPKFVEATTDLVLRDVSELFQMCLIVFKTNIRPLIRSELDRWAGKHYRRMTDDQIELAAPEEIRSSLKPESTRTEKLRDAAVQCEVADGSDGGSRLFTLYANIARIVYQFEQPSAPASSGSVTPNLPRPVSV
jgi:hypothetical protein